MTFDYVTTNIGGFIDIQNKSVSSEVTRLGIGPRLPASRKAVMRQMRSMATWSRDNILAWV